jgi:lipase maturation factor 1
VKQPAAGVASRPAKPLMIYDGDCNFCKFWIVRWQRATAGRVDYLASQDPRVAASFPELPRERLDAAAQLIETDGRVYNGAEAVFRSLAYGRFLGWPWWLYKNVPGVEPVTEWGYGFVAERRTGFSRLTRLLWGREGAAPDYSRVRWLFLRLLGLIYLCAFWSLGSQILGLMGSNGILPTAPWLEAVKAQLNQQGVDAATRIHWLPTLCWLDASDGFLRFLCWAGAGLSILLILNVAPAVCLLLLWVDYLSLTTVGREFLGFQWDNLLLETGLLAVLFAPLQFRPWLRDRAPPSRIALWLLRWLLFRLMFESGAVKLAGDDPAHPAWRNLTALNVHYETQPLPTWIGWYAHQLPEGIQHFCVASMFVIELGVPLLIFAPRRLRFLGCGLLVLLQAAIMITGNYCFFNWLTLALCLLLLDDAALRKLIPKQWRPAAPGAQPEPEPAAAITTEQKESSPVTALPPRPAHRNWPVWLTGPVAVVILVVTLPQLFGTLEMVRSAPAPVADLMNWLEPFRSVNSYGLFARMTTTRPEIIIEGSNDGVTWLPYEFKYKPGDLKRRPAFVAPHQPRLDWQMWFAALGTPRQNAWLASFCIRVLQGSPEVLGLLRHNPFPDQPPKLIRAVVYEYHFTGFKERREQGTWWRRELKGLYLPSFSLEDVGAAQEKTGEH